MTYQLILSSLTAAVLAGCAGVGHQPSATADLHPKSGSSVTGKVHFVQTQHGPVKVSGQISGLPPNSEHGFHIHEKGDCSSPDATSAGGHFNPGNAPHGQHGHSQQHAGDLPNLRSNANGMAIVQYDTEQVRLGHGSNQIDGLALIVHANPDDYQSQPTGNAGARLACGVIAR